MRAAALRCSERRGQSSIPGQGGVEEYGQRTLIDNFVGGASGEVTDSFSYADGPLTTWASSQPWESTKAYFINELATLAGVTYICTLGHTNHTPPNGTYWAVGTTLATPQFAVDTNTCWVGKAQYASNTNPFLGGTGLTSILEPPGVSVVSDSSVQVEIVNLADFSAPFGLLLRIESSTVGNCATGKGDRWYQCIIGGIDVLQEFFTTCHVFFYYWENGPSQFLGGNALGSPITDAANLKISGTANQVRTGIGSFDAGSVPINGSPSGIPAAEFPNFVVGDVLCFNAIGNKLSLDLNGTEITSVTLGACTFNTSVDWGAYYNVSNFHWPASGPDPRIIATGRYGLSKNYAVES